MFLPESCSFFIYISKFIHGHFWIPVSYSVNNMVLSLSLLAFYWLQSPIPTFQGITWPCALVKYWFCYSLWAFQFSTSQDSPSLIESHPSYSDIASIWNTCLANFMQTDTVSFNQDALSSNYNQPLQLLSADQLVCAEWLQLWQSFLHYICPVVSSWYSTSRSFQGEINRQLFSGKSKHNGWKLLVATPRHQRPDCSHSKTPRDLWHLVCIQRSTTLCPHTPTNPVHLMNLFIKPRFNWHLVDWVGREVMQCECKATAVARDQQKRFHKMQLEVRTDINPAIKHP